jgi:putative membrane protein
MTDPAQPNPRFDVSATVNNHFAWVRTALALERTMMAWLRTAVSLIGFGFAIVQFFARVEQMPQAHAAYLPRAPEYLGLALISCGVFALLVSLWQYHWTRRYMSHGAFAPIAGMKQEGMRSPVIGLAVLLICIGLFAFCAVLFRLS